MAAEDSSLGEIFASILILRGLTFGLEDVARRLESQTSTPTEFQVGTLQTVADRVASKAVVIKQQIDAFAARQK